MSNNTFYAPNDYRNYLEHHGIRGMKWGVRRFQNKDGSYTSAGKKRYGVGDGETYGGVKNALRSAGRKITGADLTPEQKAARNAKIKKVALAVAGTAAVAAGAYYGRKYYKTTMAEAIASLDKARTRVVTGKTLDDLLNASDARREAAREYSGHVGKTDTFARKAYEQLQAATAKEKAAFEAHQDVKRFSENKIANKEVRRKAQRAVVQRDIDNVRNSLAESARKRAYRRDLKKSAKFGTQRPERDVFSKFEDQKRTRRKFENTLDQLVQETPLERELRNRANNYAKKMRG